MINLLNASKIEGSERLSGKKLLILDTGASSHMTGHLDNLNNIKSSIPCSIGLPDGRETVAVEQGDTNLSEKFKVHNVLYVPDLQCNLLSISQLIDENDCEALFTKNDCILQDQDSEMVIGIGEHREGLYIVKGSESVAAVKSGENCEVWHQRLGHPPSRVVGLLPFDVLGVSDHSNKACDVCLKSKQTRDVFPINDNKTSEIFELIHCDLWGPYRVPAHCGSRCFLTIVDDFSRRV